MISGGTPATAKLTNRAIGFKPSLPPGPSDITSAAAAPSLVCEEFPAVTDPLHVKDRLQFCQCLERRVAPRTLIPEQHVGSGRLYRHNFFCKLSRGLGMQCVLMAPQSEGVLFCARNTVPSLQGLGGKPHAHVDFWPHVDERRIRSEFVSRHRDHTHRLTSTCEHNVRAAAPNTIRSEGDRLQTRRAEAIDRHPGNAVRESGAQSCYSRHVYARLRFRHRAPEDDVVDFICRNLRIFIQERLKDERREVIGPDLPQSALGAFPTAVRKQSIITASCMCTPVCRPALSSSVVFPSSACTGFAPEFSVRRKG